jgi:hypothetical protein
VYRHYGVRTDRYKLISFYDRRQWELYDLEKDPREMKNVYDDPAYAKQREELTAEFKRVQAEAKETGSGREQSEARAAQKALRAKQAPAACAVRDCRSQDRISRCSRDDHRHWAVNRGWACVRRDVFYEAGPEFGSFFVVSGEK